MYVLKDEITIMLELNTTFYNTLSRYRAIMHFTCNICLWFYHIDKILEL